MLDTTTRKIGHYRFGYGFLRAYHGQTQIGSTATQDAATRREWLDRMAVECSRRENDGARVSHGFGGFYRD